MNKSSFGTHFTVTTWGESHGKALGACRWTAARQGFLSVKKTSKNFSTDANPVRAATQLHVRRAILSEILSGVFEGKTTGTPISLIVRNTDQRSRDYGNIALFLSSRTRRLYF